MNYRHAFHAGNFADVMKHAILVHLLGVLTRESGAMTVIDTHAGAGIHDLRAGEALRTGEAAGGVVKLMAGVAPPVFDPLRAAVRRANRGEEVRFYPGSPLLIADTLRARDRLIACELRPDDYAALKAALPRQAGAEVLREDGWRVASDRARGAARLLILTDPPYEDPTDGARAAAMVADVLRESPRAVIAIWAPIKDLDGFYGLVEGIHDSAGRAPLVLAQSRIRPLTNPLTMNGSAMIVVNAPAVLEPCHEISTWIADHLGSKGALGRAELM